jgi:hypothetical protein
MESEIPISEHLQPTLIVLNQIRMIGISVDIINTPKSFPLEFRSPFLEVNKIKSS